MLQINSSIPIQLIPCMTPHMFVAHESVFICSPLREFMHSKHSVINFLSRFIRRDPFYLFSTFIIFRGHRSCIRGASLNQFVVLAFLSLTAEIPCPTNSLTNSINTNRFCRRRAFLHERRLRNGSPKHMLENTFLSTGREILFFIRPELNQHINATKILSRYLKTNKSAS